jgi:hypothetical protein
MALPWEATANKVMQRLFLFGYKNGVTVIPKPQP